VKASRFAAGRSTHADRLSTIREVDTEFGRLIDPHTADGVFVARPHQRVGVPMVCLETALPIKFEDTVKEAVGRSPERPTKFGGIETLERQFTVLDNDVDALKAFVAGKLAEQR
jgi:threonine synthase